MATSGRLLWLGGLVAALGLGGACAGHVEVSAAKGEVRVSFSGGHGQKLPVSSIAVFDASDGRRGRTVCEVSAPSMEGMVKLSSWRYGSVIDGYSVTTPCERLEPQKKYGGRVMLPSHDVLVTYFVLQPDGSAKDLGPQ
jgi:hypothetical protein